MLSQKQASVMVHTSNANRAQPKQNYNSQNSHFQHKYSNNLCSFNFQNYSNRYSTQNYSNWFHPQNYSNANQTQNYFRQLFPSQPINVQPRQDMPPQKFFSNSNVFGPPRNVFQPTGKTPNYKPEPMSTSTRNTFQKQKPNIGTYKNYSHELHNIQTTDNFSELQEIFNLTPVEYNNFNNAQVSETAGYVPMHENEVNSHEYFADDINFCQASTSNDLT